MEKTKYGDGKKISCCQTFRSIGFVRLSGGADKSSKRGKWEICFLLPLSLSFSFFLVFSQKWSIKLVYSICYFEFYLKHEVQLCLAFSRNLDRFVFCCISWKQAQYRQNHHILQDELLSSFITILVFKNPFYHVIVFNYCIFHMPENQP